MEEKYAIEMLGITKKFGNILANDHIDIRLQKGHILALCGENGAGKSTLMSILFGLHKPDEGIIKKDGEVVKITNPNDATKLHIGMVHQHFMLVDTFTVLQNIILGDENLKEFKSELNVFKKTMNFLNKHIFKFVDYKEARKEVNKIIEQYDLQVDLDKRIKDISVEMQQKVEIIKMLYRKNDILIFDEPTAVLTEQEIQDFLKVLRNLKKEGKSIIFISHKLNEVSYVADKITVDRHGSTIETVDKATDDISEDRIIKGMVGREMTDRFPRRHDVKIGDVAMEVKDWTVYHPQFAERKVVDGVSMNVRKGEVVGIAGLMGAGRTELAMSIFGKSYGTNISGQLILNGEEVHLKNIKDAIKHKIAYVTEDRKGNGLVLTNPIKINTTLANLSDLCSKHVIDQDKEYQVAEEYRDKLKTKCPTVEQNVGNLSGGNQQKVLLAKWMFANPDVLILDEPTRGIDVGAKYEIYCIINDLVAAGKSVIMISSELPEVLGMSDRIYVMNEGKMVGEMAGSEASQESIMSCILKS